MKKLTSLFLAIVLAGCFGEGPPGSGSIDGMELGLELELHLRDIQRAQEVSPGDYENIGSLVPGASLDSLRIYSAVAPIDEVDVPLRIALTRLPSEVFAAVAVDNSGNVKRFRIWGLEDKGAAWENFWRQFEYKDTRRTLAATAANSDSASIQFTRMLQSSTDSVDTVRRDAYQHSLLMRSNSQLIRGTMAALAGDATPDPDWYENYIAEHNRLKEIVTTFEPWIGDDAVTEYHKVADEAIASLTAIKNTAAENNTAGVRNAIMDHRRRACGGCHGISSHDLGDIDLDDALLDRFEAEGVDRKWYRVGLDVWSVPGEETASQEVASTLKAMLMHLHNAD